jgi:hypothetical protein
MTDIEIDRALALAIGWKRMLPNPEADGLKQCWVWAGSKWRLFSHKDWNVIGPIMERYNASPIKSPKGTWSACVDEVWVDGIDTPQKAIALAVIEGAKK